jgi:hypothetical protein
MLTEFIYDGNIIPVLFQENLTPLETLKGDDMNRVLIALVVFLALYLYLPWTSDTVHGYPTCYPTGTTILDPEKACNGYTLFAAVDSISNQKEIVLINMVGNIVHRWNPEASFGYAKPLPNGNLLAFTWIDSLSGPADDLYCGVIEIDWESTIVWEYCNPIHSQLHHDFERLENGNTLLLARKELNAPNISSDPVVNDYIVEIRPQGGVVWRWDTCQHFDEFEFRAEAKQMIFNSGGDWAHTNSIQSLPVNPHSDPAFEEGNILVSQRETNIIFIIDKETGDIVWKIGPDDNLTIGQHDAKMIPDGYPGAGNIIVFDNGGSAGYPAEFRSYSRVLEIDPLTREIAWEYDALRSGREALSFFSPRHSGVQRLPNGNTLICESHTGRFFEVAADGEIVWEYVNPFFTTVKFGSFTVCTNRMYRISRVFQTLLPSVSKSTTTG